MILTTIIVVAQKHGDMRIAARINCSWLALPKVCMVPWKLSWPFVAFCNDALAEHLHAGTAFLIGP